MRNKNSHNSITKRRTLNKCNEIFVAYNDTQWTYAEVLEKDDEIERIQCNVPIDDQFTTDFVCTQKNKKLSVIETVSYQTFLKPTTMKLLSLSLNHWLSRGVSDYRVIIGRKQNENE